MLKRLLNSAILSLFISSVVQAATFPQRIASGTVGTDEILLQLLKGDEQRLIAVSTFAVDPRYSFIEKLPRSVKGRVGENIESLLLLKPDLVIIASYTSADVTEQLKAAKVNVQVQKSFGSLKDIEANILELGKLTGKDKEAEVLVASMETTVDKAIANQPKCKQRPKVLQYASSDILPGRDTIIDDIMERAGFHNVLRDIEVKGWAPISSEVIVQQKPDFIIASAVEAPNKGALIEKMMHSAAWQKLDAVKKGRVILVPDRLLYTVSHHAAELVVFLAKELNCSVPDASVPVKK
jgi:iron complex transport system substrate-binding protein